MNTIGDEPIRPPKKTKLPLALRPCGFAEGGMVAGQRDTTTVLGSSFAGQCCGLDGFGIVALDCFVYVDKRELRCAVDVIQTGAAPRDLVTDLGLTKIIWRARLHTLQGFVCELKRNLTLRVRAAVPICPIVTATTAMGTKLT